MHYGDNGILKGAETAVDKYQNKADQEQNELAKIDNYIQNGRETVTISKEEYENLKPNSIKADSLLMTSTNNNLNVGTLNLSNFTNSFTKNFENYFTYDNATGNLTCKKDGWYAIRRNLDIYNNSSNWSNTKLYLYINNIDMGDLICVCSPRTTESTEQDTNTIYLKQGDTIKFTKVTTNATVTVRNVATITIIKL